jgi:hypothetical protein
MLLSRLLLLLLLLVPAVEPVWHPHLHHGDGHC